MARKKLPLYALVPQFTAVYLAGWYWRVLLWYSGWTYDGIGIATIPLDILKNNINCSLSRPICKGSQFLDQTSHCPSSLSQQLLQQFLQLVLYSFYTLHLVFLMWWPYMAIAIIKNWVLLKMSLQQHMVLLKKKIYSTNNDCFVDLLCFVCHSQTIAKRVQLLLHRPIIELLNRFWTDFTSSEWNFCP